MLAIHVGADGGCAPGHFSTPPELDPRTSLPMAQRGLLASGHSRTLPCAACARPRPAPTPATARAPATLVPPPPPADLVVPSVERSTARVAGDPALVPTLRALVPVEARVAAPRRRRSPAPPPAPSERRPRRPASKALLVALWSLGAGPVAFADLVIRAWERSPEHFGMRGQEQRHPDTNAVLVKLHGAKGLCARGWCTRTAPRRFEITDEGSRVARRCMRGDAR